MWNSIYNKRRHGANPSPGRIYITFLETALGLHRAVQTLFQFRENQKERHCAQKIKMMVAQHTPAGYDHAAIALGPLSPLGWWPSPPLLASSRVNR
jgi:hypothetical protein